MYKRERPRTTPKFLGLLLGDAAGKVGKTGSAVSLWGSRLSLRFLNTSLEGEMPNGELVI